MVYQQPPNVVADWDGPRAKCHPMPLAGVKAAGFLGRRIEANVTSILAAMESSIPKGFMARARGEEPGPETRRLAADSDLYKWVEGASYAFARTGNPDVKQALDQIAQLIVACQDKDGYINTQVPPKSRFDTSVNHDLYIAGHFFEAAVAHHRATGDAALLNAARRWADYLIAQYEANHPYFQTVGRKEHSEYELGLLRLYRETGDERYLAFALDLARMCTVGPRVADVRAGGGLHAVRVGYLLASYADLYMESGQGDLYAHLPGLWDELVATRLYITGGLGSIESIPRFPHVLPQSLDYHPDRDVAETCASVAMMMFSWRMHAISAESRYFDTIETILYNHYLGALSLDNLGTFYYNPLRLVGDQTGATDHAGPRTARTRLPAIHSTACCMPNTWRFLAALPEYLYSYDAQGLYVNLYTSGSVDHITDGGTPVSLSVETAYPHQGEVTIRVESDRPAQFALRLRIPAWCRDASLCVNGSPAEHPTPGTYASVERAWHGGDTVQLCLDMPPRLLWADPRIADAAGHVAFCRGPLVYCLEQEDTRFPIERARIPARMGEELGGLRVEWRNDLLGGVHVLRVPGIAAPAPGQLSTPYWAPTSRGETQELTLVPFYARANRSDDNRWLTFIPIG